MAPKIKGFTVFFKLRDCSFKEESCYFITFLQDTVITLIKEAMVKNAATSKGFLIDGYPREIEQGTRFEKEVTILISHCEA